MKQEDLYNKLCKIKNKLQEQVHNYSSDRKPSICTDDSLRLLAKYRPKSLEDMENINGIGKSFIENYGNYFLKEIINWESIDKVNINEEEKKF